MELSLLQAILLGLYYWFAVWYMGYSVLFVFTGPLFTAMICGFVLGDVSTAMKIGYDPADVPGLYGCGRYCRLG